MEKMSDIEQVNEVEKFKNSLNELTTFKKNSFDLIENKREEIKNLFFEIIEKNYDLADDLIANILSTKDEDLIYRIIKLATTNNNIEVIKNIVNELDFNNKRNAIWCIYENCELFLNLYDQGYLESVFNEHPKFYFELLNSAYRFENYKIIDELEKNLEQNIRNLKDKDISIVLNDIRLNDNPNIKLFNLLLNKIEVKNIKNYLKPINFFNNNKQGNKQVTVVREFKKTGDTVEIKDIAYTRTKYWLLSLYKNKSYEVIHSQDYIKIITQYKANSNEELFTITKQKDELTKFFLSNENEILDFKNEKNEEKKTNMKKNILKSFKKEVIKLYNINYPSIDGFDSFISYASYALLYLEEILENNKNNLVFKNIKYFDYENKMVMENISDEIINSLSYDNKNKTFIFDFDYRINKDIAHNAQIIVHNGKAIAINTGCNRHYEFNKMFFEKTNQITKEKFKKIYGEEISYNPIEEFKNAAQIIGNCNIASKIVTETLIRKYEKYRRKTKTLSPITEKLSGINDIYYKFREENKDKILNLTNPYERVDFITENVIFAINDQGLKEIIFKTIKSLKKNYNKHFYVFKNFDKRYQDFENEENRLKNCSSDINKEIINKNEEVCEINTN